MREEEFQEKPSKTQRKKAMLELQSLGEHLVDLELQALKRLDLDEELLDAIIEAKTIKKFGARRRQLQYIGKLMRQVDADKLRQSLTQLLNK